MSSIAADEVRKLSERVRFGHKQAIKNGNVLGNNRIFGYDKQDCKLTINEKEAEMVKLIFELYGTGDYSARAIEKELEQRKDKSAWNKGVTAYALELLEDVADNEEVTKERLLNGASDWNQYSWGGSSLIYDEDIAKRLCTPSELKKTRNGERKPNASEEWLDTQARALYQACNRIMKIARQ
jgi:hypothetical protein